MSTNGHRPISPDIAMLVLPGSDDKTFCQGLVSIARQASEGVALIFEAWALERLKLIYRRDQRLYLGTFLPLLKQAFPGQVNPRDLQTAMGSLTGEASVSAGDYTPEVWGTAMDDLLRYGPPQGYAPGWSTLAHYYTVRLGQMTIVTGMPASMKSALVHGLCLNLAERYDWRISLFTPEHYPLSDLGKTFVEAYARTPVKRLHPDDWGHAQEWVTTHFHPIMTHDEVQPTISWILAVARKQKERYGLQGLVIDPWNRIEHAYSEHETGEKYLAAALSQITRFAQHQQVHVWVVAHPQKPSIHEKARPGQDYEGHYPPRTLYDISGGAHFANMADAGLSIWRDAIHDSPEIEVHIQKVRNREVGRVGMIHLRHDSYRFQECQEPATEDWVNRGD